MVTHTLTYLLNLFRAWKFCICALKILHLYIENAILTSFGTILSVIILLFIHTCSNAWINKFIMKWILPHFITHYLTYWLLTYVCACFRACVCVCVIYIRIYYYNCFPENFYDRITLYWMPLAKLSRESAFTRWYRLRFCPQTPSSRTISALNSANVDCFPPCWTAYRV